MRKPFAARRQAVFFLARHLAERAIVPVRQEHRIVAETLVAARRPDQRAVDARFKVFKMPVGPGHAERGYKAAATLLGRGLAEFPQFVIDRLHREVEVFLWSRPTRRI